MEKEFVPYELAVKLKELGFDEPCLAGYSTSSENLEYYSRPLITKDSFTIDVPLYQQAFRWLRKKYGIFVSIVPNKYGSLDSFLGWIYVPLNGTTKDINVGDYNKGFNTPEEAEIACLEKLIETFKTK
jgi:hypothetical protein